MRMLAAPLAFELVAYANKRAWSVQILLVEDLHSGPAVGPAVGPAPSLGLRLWRGKLEHGQAHLSTP